MRRVTLIKGDGIGPEISDSVLKIIKEAGAEIDWDIQTAGADVIETEGTPLPQRVLDSVKRNGVALKSPVTTPIGKGFRSVKNFRFINSRGKFSPYNVLHFNTNADVNSV